jgi:hypothetical protein
MTCNWKRPASVTCACGTRVTVGKHGPVPQRCRTCARNRLLQQNKDWRAANPNGLVAPREKRATEALGPERPLFGMTAEELVAWREKRAVHLYRTEPELRLSDIAERLGLSPKQVGQYLNRAGISIRDDGRGQLPSGPPSP